MTEDIKASAYKVRGKLRGMKASIEADEENSKLLSEEVGSVSVAPNPRWNFPGLGSILDTVAKDTEDTGGLSIFSLS